jgi:molybdate transport system substrate-binding protein
MKIGPMTRHAMPTRGQTMKTHAIKTAALMFTFAFAVFVAARASEITVFAAASLTDALKETARAYEARSGDTVLFNFGASSLLARQIEEGAPADAFFSADEAKMDSLAARRLILKETRKSRLSNSLVIVTSADGDLNITSPADLAASKVKRIALADPKAVPAGIYSKEFLERQKLWPQVEPKVVAVDNVRAALAAVESGNIEVGMVFKTDAAISKNVKIAYEVPTDAGPKISYPVAVMKNAKQVESAKKFVEYLRTDDAAKTFIKYGFIVLK